MLSIRLVNSRRNCQGRSSSRNSNSNNNHRRTLVGVTTIVLLALSTFSTVITGFVLPTSAKASIATTTTTTTFSRTAVLAATTVVEQWSLTKDGRIQGIILPEGDKITTSPLKNPTRKLNPQSIVQTLSGSTYRLGTPQQQRQGIVGAASKGSAATAVPIQTNRRVVTATTPIQKGSSPAFQRRITTPQPISPTTTSNQSNEQNKKFILTPILGGAAVALGAAAIGSNNLNVNINDNLSSSLDTLKTTISTAVQSSIDPSKAFLENLQAIANTPTGNVLPSPPNLQDVQQAGQEYLEKAKTSLPLPDIKSLPSSILPDPSLPKSFSLPTFGEKAVLKADNPYVVKMPYLDAQIELAKQQQQQQQTEAVKGVVAPPPPSPTATTTTTTTTAAASTQQQRDHAATNQVPKPSPPATAASTTTATSAATASQQKQEQATAKGVATPLPPSTSTTTSTPSKTAAVASPQQQKEQATTKGTATPPPPPSSTSTTTTPATAPSPPQQQQEEPATTKVVTTPLPPQPSTSTTTTPTTSTTVASAQQQQQQQDQARLKELEEAAKAKKEQEALKLQQQQQEEALKRQQEEQSRMELARQEQLQKQEAMRLQLEAEKAMAAQKAAEEAFNQKLKEAEEAAAKTEKAVQAEALQQQKMAQTSSAKTTTPFITSTVRVEKQAQDLQQKTQLAQQEFVRKLDEAEAARLQEEQLELESSQKQQAAQQAQQAAAAAAAAASAQQAQQAAASASSSSTSTVGPSKGATSVPSSTTAGRSSSSSSTTLSTYDQWQQRQRMQYQAAQNRLVTPSEMAAARKTVAEDSADNSAKSAFDRWQQAQAAKTLADMSEKDGLTKSTTSSSSSSLPPIMNQIISGKSFVVATATTTTESRAATLALVLGGTALAIGVLARAYEQAEEGGTSSTVTSSPVVASSTPAAGAAFSSTTSLPAAPAASFVSTAPRKTYQLDQKQVTGTSAALPSPAATTVAQPPRRTMSVQASTATATRTDVSRIKSSYSPFGRKPKVSATTSDSLYAAPTTSTKNSDDSSMAPTQATSAQSTGSYMDSLAESKGTFKKTYAPFGAAKPMAATSGISEYVPPFEATAATTNAMSPSSPNDEILSRPERCGSYLEFLGGQFDRSSLKSSYSPFGSGKPTASSTLGNSLYAPASAQSSVVGSSGSNIADVSDMLPPLEVSSIADAAINMGSYLDTLAGGKSQLKGSYSPFGRRKPMAADSSNNALYSPDSTELSSEILQEQDTIEAIASGNGGSYLDALGGGSGGSLKASYSPFGRRKSTPATGFTGMQYDPVTSMASEQFYESCETSTDPSNEMNVQSSRVSSSYMQALEGNSTAPSKSSYSPFGRGKHVAAAVSSRMTYEPSSDAAFAKSRGNAAPTPSTDKYDSVGSGRTATYLELLGDNNSPSKSTYSPFGSVKPSVSSNRNVGMMYDAPTATRKDSEVFDSIQTGAGRNPGGSSSFPFKHDNGSASTGTFSYLQTLAGSVGYTKSSYSPFGSSFPSKGLSSSANDRLNDTPSMRDTWDSSSINGSGSSVQPQSSIKESSSDGVTYPQALGGTEKTAAVKASYSPFGTKPSSSSSSAHDFLYSPPTSSS